MILLENKWIKLFFFILFIPNFIFSQKESDLYYKEAIQLIEKGNNLEKANTLLDRALQSDSLNRNYLILKSKVLYLKSDCSNSFRYLNKVILMDKKFTDSTAIFFSDLSDCLKDKATAIEVLKDHLDKTKSALVKVRLAQKYFLNNQHEEAIRLYQEYVRDHPKDIEATIDLARIFFTTKNEDRAINALQNSLKIQPDNVMLLSYLFSLYAHLKRYEEAIVIVNNIIKNEYKLEHIINRSILFELVDKTHEAYEDFKRIVKLDPCNSEYYIKILQYEFDHKLYDQVIQSSNKFIACDSKNEAIVLDGLYTSLFFCNDYKKGLLYLDKRMEQNPNTFNPNYIKILTLLKSKNYAPLIDYAKKAYNATDATAENKLKVNFLLLGYYLLVEDYSGFAKNWKSGDNKGIDEFWNLKVVENANLTQVEVTIDFDKTAGIINTTLSIPLKIVQLLKDNYGVNLIDIK